MEAEKTPIIEVRNLYKIYKVGTNRVYALNGVDFTMYKGEFCAIVGPSGSGKSTLLNMLAGLEPPTKGEIIVAGEHIEKMSENRLVGFRRENVGFIFQSYNLLQTLNAVANVALLCDLTDGPVGHLVVVYREIWTPLLCLILVGSFHVAGGVVD